MENNNNRQSAAKQNIELKDIPGFEGMYAVSKNGDVYSYKTNKFFNPSKNKDGYLKVALRVNNKAYYYRVHKLVAMTYLDNPNNLSEVNHKDFNRQNNCLDNLEWISHDDNILHSKINGRFKSDKPLRKAYMFTNVFNGESFTIIGIKNVARHFGFKSESITALKKHVNTGEYVKTGILKNLRIDSMELKVQRLEEISSQTQVSRNAEHPVKDEDIV